MTNINNLKPIENKKPVETAYEIKNEIPSFEEFMKNYNENEKVIDNYQGEFEGYEDVRVKGTYYGPGFWDDVGKPLLKFGGKVVVSGAVAGSIIATGGATAPLLLATGATGYGTGKFISTVAKGSDSEVWEWVGDTISDTGLNVLTGSLAGTQDSFKSLATIISESGAKGSSAVREFQRTYDKWEKVKDIRAGLFHAKHKGAGIEYHSWCGVCN